MSSYVVTSGRLVGHPEGSTVTDDEIGGCDVAALVSAGHLTPQPPAKKSVTPDQADPATSPKE